MINMRIRNTFFTVILCATDLSPDFQADAEADEQLYAKGVVRVWQREKTSLSRFGLGQMLNLIFW